MPGKITDLGDIPSVNRSTNRLEIVDVSGNASYKVSPNNLLGITGNPVGDTDSQTLSAKTLTNPTINGATLSGTLAGTYTLGGTPTFPASVVTLTGSQTLTNKTLTSPTISSPTITNASITADAITGFTTGNSGSVYGMAVVGGLLSSSALPSNIASSKLSNPYKFSVYRSAALNSASASFSKVNFDTKLYDTGSNFDNVTNFRFTAPVAGFYHFSWGAASSGTATRWVTGLFKNGSTEVGRGGDVAVSSSPNSSYGSKDLQLVAGDTIEVQLFANAAIAIQPGLNFTYFDGFLVSTT